MTDALCVSAIYMDQHMSKYLLNFRFFVVVVFVFPLGLLSGCAGGEAIEGAIGSSEEIHPTSREFATLVNAGKKIEAHQLIKAAALKSPDNIQFQRILAISERGQGDIDAGINRLRALKNKRPGDLQSRELIVDFLLRKGDLVSHKIERESLIEDYNNIIKNGDYSKGSFKFPREFFYVKGASSKFDENEVIVDGYQYYGWGMDHGRGGPVTRHYRFNLVRQNKTSYGYILLATNSVENDLLRNRNMIKAGNISYYVRFYVGNTGQRSKLIQFIQSKSTPPFEAARQVVINYIKGRRSHWDLEKWMPEGFKNMPMPNTNASVRTVGSKKWTLDAILADCLKKAFTPPPGTGNAVLCGPSLPR
jgi:hypothetical protein